MSDAVRVEVTPGYSSDLGALDGAQQVRITKRIQVLPTRGWSASVAAGDVSPLRDGIWEVRILGKGPAYRVLFFVCPGHPGRLVVLAACVAKGDMLKRKVMDAEIERAKQRRDHWLAARERNDVR